MFDDTMLDLGDVVHVTRTWYETESVRETDAPYVSFPSGPKFSIIAAFPKRYRGRLHNFAIRPGLYFDRSAPVVIPQEDFGKDPEQRRRIEVAACDVIHFDPVKRAKRRSAAVHLPCPAVRRLKERDFDGDLPETPFWEGDIVRARMPDGKERMGFVVDIDYDTIVHVQKKERKLRIKLPARRVYGVASRLTGDPEWVYAEDLQLVERGNVWRLHHGQPLRLGGKPFEELYDLSIATGRYDGVPPSVVDVQQWDKASAVVALSSGEADWFLVGRPGIFPGRPVTHLAIKFFDRDFGRHSAERALASFRTPK